MKILGIILTILIIVVPLLIAVAYFTLAERKILGAIQRRRGPNVVGAFGLLQPLADGLKLLLKEVIIPSNANQIIFIFSPILTFTISLVTWAVIPFDAYSMLSDINLGVLYLFAMSSLGVYGIILSGWSSNSKYAFLGALRSSAQMISYEVSIGFIISTLCLFSGSFNFTKIIETQTETWFIIPFFPLFLIFLISGLAETNRHPFDLPEAEAELVSGYNVEYSSMSFALFSLGEYSNMLLMSSFISILFLGGWLAPLSIPFFYGSFWFSLKILIFVIIFILARGILPRYRYDQLMTLGWKVFLPLVIAYFIFNSFIVINFNILPF